MNTKDYFKKSVWETFMEGQNMSAQLTMQIVIALAASVIMGLIIYKVYQIYFGGVVFSRSFATTLVGMTVLTCMLTLAISSNIVISLGMVGALSIVRYRTAIKDPIDLLYLFWSISVGITLGAGLYALALIATVIMILVIHLLYHKKQKGMIYILVVHYDSDMAGDVIIRSLRKLKFQLKSRTIRDRVAEMTIELWCKDDNLLFMEEIRDMEKVRDVTLMQYNGEYHG